MPVLRFVGHGPSDQLGPICAPLADPDAAAAVAGAIDAIPLRRFVLLAEHVAGDQGFAALNGACPLYRESSPVLRFEVATWDEFLGQRGRNFRQQVRRFPRKLGELGPCRTASPQIPSGCSAIWTRSSGFIGTVGRRATPFLRRQRSIGNSRRWPCGKGGCDCGSSRSTAGPSPRFTVSGSPAPSRPTRPDATLASAAAGRLRPSRARCPRSAR